MTPADTHTVTLIIGHDPQSESTVRDMNRARIRYTLVDEDSETGRELLAGHGLHHAPAVIIDGQTTWNGYRPDLIRRLAIRTGTRP